MTKTTDKEKLNHIKSRIQTMLDEHFDDTEAWAMGNISNKEFMFHSLQTLYAITHIIKYPIPKNPF